MNVLGFASRTGLSLRLLQTFRDKCALACKRGLRWEDNREPFTVKRLEHFATRDRLKPEKYRLIYALHQSWENRPGFLATLLFLIPAGVYCQDFRWPSSREISEHPILTYALVGGFLAVATLYLLAVRRLVYRIYLLRQTPDKNASGIKPEKQFVAIYKNIFLFDRKIPFNFADIRQSKARSRFGKLYANVKIRRRRTILLSEAFTSAGEFEWFSSRDSPSAAEFDRYYNYHFYAHPLIEQEKAAQRLLRAGAKSLNDCASPTLIPGKVNEVGDRQAKLTSEA